MSSSALYLVMDVLQLIAVCFNVFCGLLGWFVFPMLVRSSIHCAWVVGLGGRQGGGGVGHACLFNAFVERVMIS